MPSIPPIVALAAPLLMTLAAAAQLPAPAVTPETPAAGDVSVVANTPDPDAASTVTQAEAPRMNARDDRDAVADTHPGIRIVRLSETKGVVAMSRGFAATPGAAAAPFEPAFDNLPVVQGAELRTGEGVAEVEFEDNTTLRLAPDTLVRFGTLRRDADGTTTSVMEVVHGMAFAATAKGRSANVFALGFGGRRAVLAGGTHVRLQLADARTHLSVLDGVATVESATGNVVVEKKHGLLVDPANPAVATLTGKEGEASPFDAWDKQSASYHQSLGNASAYAGTGAGSGLYGLNDLSYYGSFVNMGSCGSMWQPYFASAGWNPYAYGVFAYYPGAGYSFVSPYPWGWTPFHSGAWQQCGASGWGWRPGGAFTGLGNTSTVLRATVHAPLVSPRPGQLGLVVVHTRPPALSHMTAEGAFVFNRDSAGLGVPRGSFGKLGGTSRMVAEHGSANVMMESRVAAGGASAAHAALAGALRPATAGPVGAGSHPAAGAAAAPGGYGAGNASSHATAAAPAAAASHSTGGGGSSHH